MTFTSPSRNPSIQYSPATIDRAERALRCAPFQLSLFATMRWQSVELRAIAGKAGVENGYTQQSIPELAAENSLLWLIQVGLLRREVDGQGLTDSFRLTPLGHQIVEKWQNQGDKLPAPNRGDRFFNLVQQWFRLPSWF
ncbi:MAG TPA: Npun_F0494 family protein [Trichocoleus sp.]